MGPRISKQCKYAHTCYSSNSFLIMKLRLILLNYILLPLCCMAQDAGHNDLWLSVYGEPISFVVDGIRFTTNGGRENNCMTVSASAYIPEADSCNNLDIAFYVASDTLLVPHTVDFDGRTYVVTAISSHGFEGCGYIRHLIISNGVRRIGRMAFGGCMALESVSIPASVSLIDRNPFAGCVVLKHITVDRQNEWYRSESGGENIVVEKKLNCVVVGSAQSIIPSNIVTIGMQAFSGYHLQSVPKLPEGLVSIEGGCFENCQGLNGLQLPESLRTIENQAFAGSDIESIHIPAGVKQIGEGVFMRCNRLHAITVDSHNDIYDSRQECNAVVETSSSRLVSACLSSTIPDGIRKISDYAFGGLSGVTQIVLPKSVSSISPLAFAGCHSLSRITVDKHNVRYDSRENCNAVIETSTQQLVIGCGATNIPSSIRSIGPSAFAMTSLPVTLILPAGITEIGVFAFEQCSGLCNILLPSTLKTLGQGAFAGCKELRSVYIPSNTIQTISRWTFMDCINLEQIHIPSGCENVDASAFSGCTKLKRLTYESPDTHVPDDLNTERTTIF